MFTRKGKEVAFDSLSVVELEAKQSPVGGAPHLRIKLCYVNSETGNTYGHIALEHNPQMGLELLSEKTVDAWQAFCESIEKDQGRLVFGDGRFWTPQLDMFNREKDSQAESKEGLKIGMGGGT